MGVEHKSLTLSFLILSGTASSFDRLRMRPFRRRMKGEGPNGTPCFDGLSMRLVLRIAHPPLTLPRKGGGMGGVERKSLILSLSKDEAHSALMVRQAHHEGLPTPPARP